MREAPGTAVRQGGRTWAARVPAPARKGVGGAVLWAILRRPVPPRLRWALWARLHRPSPFVLRHLHGMSGIEIGAAAHNDYGLEALNVDRYAATDTVYKEEERRLCGRHREVDVVAQGDDLPFEDDAVDFVFASHVIEHFPDPLRALEEWRRVARQRVVVVGNGFVVVIDAEAARSDAVAGPRAG